MAERQRASGAHVRVRLGGKPRLCKATHLHGVRAPVVNPSGGHGEPGLLLLPFFITLKPRAE